MSLCGGGHDGRSRSGEQDGKLSHPQTVAKVASVGNPLSNGREIGPKTVASQIPILDGPLHSRLRAAAAQPGAQFLNFHPLMLRTLLDHRLELRVGAFAEQDLTGIYASLVVLDHL